MSADPLIDDVLAGEYVLGVMEDAERAAFERQLAHDPVLANCKLIAEAWDAGCRPSIPGVPLYPGRAGHRRQELLPPAVGLRRCKILRAISEVKPYNH